MIGPHDNGVEDTTRMRHMGGISNGPQDLKLLYTDPNSDQKCNFWRADSPTNFTVFGGL